MPIDIIDFDGDIGCGLERVSNVSCWVGFQDRVRIGVNVGCGCGCAGCGYFN